MIGTRLRATGVLLFVFAAGMLGGIALERHRATPSKAEMVDRHEATMASLREALSLDDQQVAQIEGLMAVHQRNVQRQWEALRPEVRTAMRQVNHEIAELLRPDQRARFHAWLLERRGEHEAPNDPHGR